MKRTIWALSISTAAWGCSPEAAKEKLDQGKEAVAAKVDDATEQAEAEAKEQLSAARTSAKEAVDEKLDELKDEIPTTGELSGKALDYLKSDDAKEGAASAIDSGAQLLPVAKEVADVLSRSVEKDLVIEPIVQKVDDEAKRAELDKQIGEMPRTEVVDGMTVGFSQMSQKSTEGTVDESAYLVMWRKGDYLLGFFYRSRKEVDVEVLVREAPRIIELVSKTVGD